MSNHEYKIAVLLPTRGRSDALERSVKTLFDLADVREQQGDIEASAQLIHEALILQEHVYGMESEKTVESAHRLGLLRLHQGRVDESARLLEGVVTYARQHLASSGSPSGELAYLMCLSDLSDVRLAQKKYEEAHDLLSECCTKRLRLQGARHPDLISCIG